MTHSRCLTDGWTWTRGEKFQNSLCAIRLFLSAVYRVQDLVVNSLAVVMNAVLGVGSLFGCVAGGKTSENPRTARVRCGAHVRVHTCERYMPVTSQFAFAHTAGVEVVAGAGPVVRL